MSDHDQKETLVTAPGTDETVATENGTFVTGSSRPVELYDGTIDGRYEIRALLGRGGAGSVYRVYDTVLGETVALKTLHTDLVEKSSALDRFRAEVRLARRVTHRNVVRTYDIGSAGNLPYLTMEFIDGAALDTMFTASNPFRASKALRIAAEVATGLAAAHEAGVIHQDLKPQNVLVEKTGRIVISDFGIARARDATVEGNQFMGTPAYMSPEQVLGEATLDARADIYALGVMIFEMLTGRTPFHGATPLATALARMLNDPPPLEGFPTPIADLVACCLQRDRANRFATADELREAIMEAAHASDSHSTTDVFPVVSRDAASRVWVAFLPLTVRGDVAGNEHLVDGITEEIVDGLSTTPGLAVKPRASVSRLAEGTDPIRAGRQLGVEVVVDGRLTIGPDGLQMRLAAISVEDGLQLWAGKFSAGVGELLQMCNQAVGEIAQSMARKSYPRPDALTDPVTVELYMRARQMTAANWHFNIDRASSTWERLLERAPDDPRVLAGAGRFFARLGRSATADSFAATSRARKYIERAIDMLPESPEPLAGRAVMAWNAFELDAALRDSLHALELAPGYPESLHMAGQILIETGPLDVGIDLLDAAHEADMHADATRWVLVRARALRGDWHEVDALLSLDVVDGGGEQRVLRQIAMARTDLWRESPRWLDEPFDLGLEGVTELAMYVPIARSVASGGALPDLREIMGKILDVGSEVPRVAAVPLQHVIELVIRAGDLDWAAQLLPKCVDRGLVDLMWLEHCPLLLRIAHTTAYREALAVVRERVEPARKVADAYYRLERAEGQLRTPSP